MSNYTQITDFSIKDALPTGDPLKTIKGSDVDAELAAIATAIATKANDNAVVHLTGTETVAGDKTFSGNNTHSGTVTISRTDTTTPLIIKTTDDGAVGAPRVNLWRDSASPAASDLLARIDFDGENDASAEKSYAIIIGRIDDPAAGTEAGSLIVRTSVAGAMTDVLTVGTGIQVGAPTGGDKGTGSVNAAAYYDNGARLLAGNVLLRDVTLVEVVNSTTETTVFSDTVTGGQLGTDRKLRITLIGRAYDNYSGTSQLTVRVKYGGTTFSTNTFTHTTTSTYVSPLFVQTEIAALNAANAQASINYGLMGDPVADGAASTPAFSCSHHGSGAVDSAVDQTLQITFQLNSASANVSAVANTVHVELI